MAAVKKLVILCGTVRLCMTLGRILILHVLNGKTQPNAESWRAPSAGLHYIPQYSSFLSLGVRAHWARWYIMDSLHGIREDHMEELDYKRSAPVRGSTASDLIYSKLRIGKGKVHIVSSGSLM